MKRTTIKSLQRMANEENANNTELGWHMTWFDLLMYWLVCGYTNMVEEFNNMSRKETLQVIDECILRISMREDSYSIKDLTSLAKCAMTSLESRL